MDEETIALIRLRRLILISITGWTLLVISVSAFGFGLFVFGITGYLELTGQLHLSTDKDTPIRIGIVLAALLLGAGGFLLGKYLLRLAAAQKQESQSSRKPSFVSQRTALGHRPIKRIPFSHAM